MPREVSIERMETWDLKRKCLELRLKKLSYRAIADEVGKDVATVYAWVKELTAIQLPQEEMEDLRAQEAAGYDESESRLLAVMEMTAAQAQKCVDAGDNPSAYLARIESLERTLMDVRKQRSLLLGLNRPTLVQHNVTVRNVLDEEIEQLVSELTGGGNIMSDPEMVDAGNDD